MPRKSDKSKAKLGLGTGSGQNHQAYFHPKEFSSDGTSHRVPSILVDRMLILASGLESNVAKLSEYSPIVTSVEEQCKLEMDQTRAIAARHGLRHPQFKGKDTVMTTDLLVTYKKDEESFQIAYSVKYSTDISLRNLEKFQIEKSYWNDKDISWFIVTEKQIPEIVIKNVSMLREHFRSELRFSDKLKSFMKGIDVRSNVSIGDASKMFAKEFKISYSESKLTFLHLFARKVMRFDLTTEFDWNMNLKGISL